MKLDKKLAEASRRTAREVFARARRELSPDTFVEPPTTIRGVTLSVEGNRVVRQAIEMFYAHEPIATPYGKLPVRDLVRGLEPPRPIRNPVVRAIMNRARPLAPPPKLTIVPKG